VAAFRLPHKNTLNGKALVERTNKASRLRGQSGLPNVCFCFVPATSSLAWFKWLFHKLTCVEQSIFLDSLKVVHKYNGSSYDKKNLLPYVYIPF
jgi:hypothetical protein